MRIGFSKDVHRLVRNRNLRLGGVNIPFKKGLLAHSDGDVVIHSLVDAIIGALNLGDIGKLFPDNDKKYENYNSIDFLDEMRSLLTKYKMYVEYIDIIKNFLDMKNPTKEIMNRLIDKIYVTKDKKLEIHYRIKKREVLM